MRNGHIQQCGSDSMLFVKTVKGKNFHHVIRNTICDQSDDFIVLISIPAIRGAEVNAFSMYDHLQRKPLANNKSIDLFSVHLIDLAYIHNNLHSDIRLLNDQFPNSSSIVTTRPG